MSRSTALKFLKTTGIAAGFSLLSACASGGAKKIIAGTVNIMYDTKGVLQLQTVRMYNVARQATRLFLKALKIKSFGLHSIRLEMLNT
jgi:hypothetical protein